MSLFEVQGLSRHFETNTGLVNRLLSKQKIVRAVDGINLSITEGEAFTLVGESGCGKTTAIRTALNIIEPTDGTVLLRGKNIGSYSRKQLRKECQLLHQDHQSTLNPRISIGEAIAEAIRYHDVVPPDQVDARVDELLEMVGISPGDKAQKPSNFSGGQKQRIALARALSVEPSLLVADEPVSGLDVSVQGQILNLLMDIQEEFDIGLIYVTHNLSVARKISDQVGVMYLGKIVEHGATSEIFDNPQHPYTQALLKAIPVPDPDVANRSSPLQGTTPEPIDIPSGCRFASRCPEAEEECKSAEMGLEPYEHNEDHLVDCIKR